MYERERGEGGVGIEREIQRQREGEGGRDICQLLTVCQVNNFLQITHTCTTNATNLSAISQLISLPAKMHNQQKFNGFWRTNTTQALEALAKLYTCLAEAQRVKKCTGQSVSMDRP